MSFDIDSILQQAARALVAGNHPAAQTISRKLLYDQPNALALEILSTSLINQIERRSASSQAGKSSVDQFIAHHLLYLDPVFFAEDYIEWRTRRIRKLLEIYGIDFTDKRILELGAAIGDIGSFFAELGAEVVGLEGRAVNCNLAKLRFRHLKNYDIRQCNLEEGLGDLGRFDLIINFGLIEVIENFEPLLKTCMDISDTMFLETMVCDSEDPHKLVYVNMPAEQSNDWPLSGKSPRPSPAYIERLFSENGFTVRRHFDHDINTGFHCYDWPHRNDGSAKEQLRRFWSFVQE